MGISRGAIKLLGSALRDRPRAGTVITFGVQSVQAAYNEAVELLAAAGIDTGAMRSAVASADIGRIHQDRLFRLLGYNAVEGIDFYPDEKPTHVIDLNHPVPSAMWGRYDLVYDDGTAEHCFAAAEMFCNALRLVKLGGHVIHHLPMNNWVDHGFYQFSPTLFFDFYGANGCDNLSLVVHFSERGKERWIRYEPGMDVDLPYSLGRDANVLAFFCATKTSAQDKIVLPIQGRYRRTFGAESGTNHARSRKSHLAKLKRSLLKRTLKWRAKGL